MKVAPKLYNHMGETSLQMLCNYSLRLMLRIDWNNAPLCAFFSPVCHVSKILAMARRCTRAVTGFTGINSLFSLQSQARKSDKRLAVAGTFKSLFPEGQN